jgi:receptor protein-tyrosine kinase
VKTIEKALQKHRDQGEATSESRTQAAPLRGPAYRERPSGGPVSPIHVDLQHLRRIGIWPPAAMERQMRDEYRRIKRPLLANSTGRGAVSVERGNLIMMTSARPAEGKTFISVNLALSIAQEPDFDVLLIDGDVLSPAVSSIFGLEDRPGLLDVLSDASLPLESVTVPTDIPSLSILPAGRAQLLSTELLSSIRMDEIAGRLAAAGSHSIVLFDSPPLLPSPEAASLAHPVGQIVFVVKEGYTQQQDVIAAEELLDPGKPINFVLNQSRAGGPDYGYYSGGYGSSGE